MILSGHHWHVHSPSLFELSTHPGLLLGYNGTAWYLGFDDKYNMRQTWPSRDAAAEAIAQAFVNIAMQEQMQ
jgi:hypothetical protein